MRLRRRGFSLMELITVLAIVGIGSGLFFSIFYLNWNSLQRQLALNDLVSEAERIIERISFDARMAREILVRDNNKTAEITSPDGIIIYTLINTGQIQRNNVSLSEYINFDNSSFRIQGRSLIVNLSLEDDVFSRAVQLPVRTEIHLRNH